MESLIFQAIDWYITDVDDEDCDISDSDEDSLQKKYLIKVFGRSEKGDAISINITDYTPYFYIKGLDNFPEQKHRTILARLHNYIIERLPQNCKNGFISIKIINKKDIWGFTNNKSHKFIRLLCRNYKTMRFLINLFSRHLSIPGLFSGFKFKLYENNIEPFLRFIHKQDLEVSGWIKIDNYQLTNNFKTKIGYNYDVQWKDVKPYTNNLIAPFIVASFDIECNSFDGSFPQASQTYNKVAYKTLEYYHSLLCGKIYTKKEKQKFINKFLIELFLNNSLNIISDYNINIIKEKIEYESDEIYAILNGRLQYREEAIINNKKKNLLSYFKTDDENNDDYDDNCEVSNSVILEKLADKFNIWFPKIEGDPIIQIGITTHLYGNKDCDRRVILTLGTCSDIDGIEVIRCPTEKDILSNFMKLINQINPDIITGYNILGFDFDYIYHRAIELDCIDVLCNLGKTENPIIKCKKECICEKNYCKNHWVKKTLSSSALGDNFLKYINMEGRVIIDLMKEIQKNHNLDSYKLDNVAHHFINGKIKYIKYLDDQKKYELKVDTPTGIQKGIYIHIGDNKYIVDNIDYNSNTIMIDGSYDDIDGDKWGLAKDDVSPQEIFECMKGTDDDRARVARYCIQDCALCNYLMIKLEIVANNIGMSNVCSIPFSYIFLRGQSVKIFSLIAKYCKENNFLIPYQDKKWKCEVCNYNNSSFDDICQRPRKDEICACPKPENEGYEGAIVLHPKPGIYDDAPISVLDYASLYPSSMISENISHDTIVLDSKYDNIPGYKYVNITYDLFKGKGDAKKKIGEQTCRFAQFPNGEKGLLPRILQKLLKQRKATRKKITWKTITLKSGNVYKGNIVSNDDNIIKLKIEDKDIMEIDTYDIESKIDTYNEFQRAVLDGLQLAYKVTANSLYGFVGAPTSQLFMKELAASTTATGRNLIMTAKKFAEEKYNCEVVYGDSVVGYSPVIIKCNDEIFFEKMEDISSKFGGDKWHPCKEQGKQDKEACELNEVYSWTSKGWTKIYRIIRHQLASHKKIIRVLTLTGCIDVTDDHSLLFKDGRKVSPKNLKIDDELLHKDLDFDLNDKLYKIIFNIVNNNFNGKISNLKNIKVKSMINALYIYYLGNLFNYIVHITDDETNNNIFYISFYNLDEYDKFSEFLNIKPHAIKKMYEIDYEGYVYDFTTYNHEFQSGIGEIVASNTDSIFIKLPPLPCYEKFGHPTEKQNILQYNVNIGEQLSADFQKLLKPPHCLEWEKMFYPFIIFSKKRYVGNVYEHDVNKFKQKSMGIVLKRRDNANIVKIIYGGIINKILNGEGVEKSLSFLHKSLDKLSNGEYPMDELIVTKTLKGMYKNPKQIAHKVLADRMKKRDPGSAPQSNDRVPYIYIQTKEEKGIKLLQGDKIENPKYATENNLIPDYGHYITNQIMKPCIQLYSMVLEEMAEYKHINDKTFWKKKANILMEEKKDKKKVDDKIKQLREKEVEEILFSKYLTKIDNKKKGARTIQEFF
mgnify:CR=1 FL=1